MGFKEKSAFCASCNRQVLVRRETPNHVLHFLVTAFTCGLWGIVWAIIILSESGKPWRCTNCGSPTTHQSLNDYRTSSLSQESSGMFGQLSTSTGLSPGKIIGLGFLGLVGLSVVISIISAVVNPPRDSKSASNQSNPTSTLSVSTINKNSADYQAGYKKGVQEGKSWARETDGGMPYPIGIRVMAQNQAKEAKAKDAEAWQIGWEEGFPKGFRSIKPAKIREEELEPLSWSNAKPGVKLYDNDGNHVVTIVAVDQSAGMITVKYGKEGKGAVENKSLDALSQFWFVRKDGK